MKCSITVLFLFAAFAAAVDIKNHFYDGCKGGYLGYRNVVQGKCARTLKHYPSSKPGGSSAKFSNVPKNAELLGWQVGSQEQGICGVLVKRVNAGSKSNFCMGALTGGRKYSGTSWKAARKATRDIGPNEDEECTGEMAAQQLVLDDGHMYDLTKMDQGTKDALYDLAVNGTKSGALPADFASYEIEKDAVQSRYQEIEDESEV